MKFSALRAIPSSSPAPAGFLLRRPVRAPRMMALVGPKLRRGGPRACFQTPALSSRANATKWRLSVGSVAENVVRFESAPLFGCFQLPQPKVELAAVRPSSYCLPAGPVVAVRAQHVELSRRPLDIPCSQRSNAGNTASQPCESPSSGACSARDVALSPVRPRSNPTPWPRLPAPWRRGIVPSESSFGTQVSRHDRVRGRLPAPTRGRPGNR